MKAILFISFIVAFYCILPSGFAQSQDTTPYRIETKDGNEFIGRIIQQDQTTIRLQTEKLGEITIQKADIKSMVAIQTKQGKDGRYWFDNPQATRYFWQPNGYGLKKGEAYYQNIWIFFNQVSVGVTDHFSVGAGLMPLFLFAGASSPAWLTPKFSIPVVKDKFNLGAGALIGTVLGEENSGYGITYGVATVGSRDKNFSFGVGYGYAGDDWAQTPTFTLSAMIRTGERGYLVTESYYIGSSDASLMLFSVGGRRIVKRVGIDFALIIPSETGGELFAFPILGLTVPFGNVPGNVVK
ncbi:MAG: hypothetical protein HRU69_05775 [Flammeovirgaceae bacterium]|nr:MAG: hypothetical protein HRU69_05775 [Flammeovirgaceae bacterium]